MFQGINFLNLANFYTGSTVSNVTYESNITSQVTATTNGVTGPVGSFATSQIIDAICEGPIEGWPTSEPLKHVYLDGTPVKSYNNTINISNLRFEFRNGSAEQNPLNQYTLIGAVKSPNYQNEIFDIADTPKGGASIIQQVQIRDDSDGAYPTVEAVAFTFTFPEGQFRYKTNGGRSSTPVGVRIRMNPKSDGSGTYIECVSDSWQAEVTSGGFELSYIVEIPPGWSTPPGLQGYQSSVDDIIQFEITKFDSDWENDRAHSKMYLKSYSIFTRNQFSFPHTAVVGLTIDSKNFDGSIPRRQYDLKLLKVKIPSNYNLVFNDRTGEVIERNYEGQWDGTFKSGLHWTDNPVWCFYDLVTNERYGLGKFIDPSLLNKWKLYEIAKYCDAVVADNRSGKPANSYTFSITDNLGGIAAAAGNSAIKEPRFTCNAIIASREEAYSLIQKLASLFRGIVFYQQGTVQLVQDRPSTPIFMYNNTNVIDGVFSYQSSSIKARHTVAIVKWLDPQDLYSEKLEYVEDYDGIARYGYREIEIDGFGCTSRGQARRIGRHILITEKFELETISFKVGMEGAVASPGSLVKIKDSNRQEQRAGGRIVSATSNSITLDKAINIPAGATSITLWVQTSTSLNETIEGNTSATYKPTLTSHSVTATAGSSNVSTLTLSSGTFSTTPASGNLWILSYIPSGSIENVSVYKILSVSENNSFEYEITALQHYSDKYTDIEAYTPIPDYNPVPLKLYLAPPEEGFISSTFNGQRHDIQITWRSDRYVSGTRYKLEMLSSNQTRVLLNGTTDTSYVYENARPGIYYFKIYALNNISREASAPLLLGPHKIKEIMPQNNFTTFSQDKFGSDYITNTWKENSYPDSEIKYELWRGATNSLRTLATSANISNVSYGTNKITLQGFDQSSIGAATNYYVEVPILPYNRYTAVNIGASPTTNSSTVILRTLEKPLIGIGDKIVNTTRNVTSNVVSFTQTQDNQQRWITQITVSPTVASQVAADIIYLYKGVLGSSFLESQSSGAIKQKTIKAIAGTTSTNITVATGGFTNVATNDIIINRTRNASAIVTKVNNQNVTTTSITGQTAGDIVAFYQANTREVRNLKKYSIDWLGTAFGGDSINVLNYDNPEIVPVANRSIMANVTKGYCAEVIEAKMQPGGVLQLATWPSLTGVSGIADGDEVIFINKDEVFTQSRNVHIHPTPGVAQAGTNTTTVVCTGLFTGAKVGDILVNATKNTSSVIVTKNSNNQVTLVGAFLPSLAISGQTTGDTVFYVAVSNFIENVSYSHPNILTTTTGTNTTTVNITTSGFAGITTSYIFYNMTRNAYSAISSVTDSDTIVLSSAISGQTVGDRGYVFLPTTVSTTVATAPDGAFNYVRPGDIFHNITRNAYSIVKDVAALTGRQDKKIDRLVLESSIPSQTAGDSFRILQGFFSSQVLSKQDNGSNDILELETVSNLELGDRAAIYLMNASRVGSTEGTTLTDTGLTPSTTYYYWMRAISSRLPYLGGNWEPTDTTGDSAATLPLAAGNYNTSNDNNSDAIDPAAITPVSPFIDLPAGGVNKDSTVNIRLYWEWTGLPNTIDGFSVYFWSSNSETDDATIDADEDYTQGTQGFSLPVNPRVTISNITYVGTTVTVTTSERHKLSNGMKVKIIGAKISGGAVMPNINTAGTGFVTVTVTGLKTFTFTAPGAPSGTYTANSGRVVSCLYTYQVNNLTANYYYNAWVQPYRQVNTTISENGIIVGTPKKLY